MREFKDVDKEGSGVDMDKVKWVNDPITFPRGIFSSLFPECIQFPDSWDEASKTFLVVPKKEYGECADE